MLDDLDLHNSEIKRHQIRTDAAIGLTLDNVRKAERLFTEGYEQV